MRRQFRPGHETHAGNGQSGVLLGGNERPDKCAVESRMGLPIAAFAIKEVLGNEIPPEYNYMYSAIFMLHYHRVASDFAVDSVGK